MTRKTSLASLRNTISKILLKACPGTPTRNTVFFHITQCCPPPFFSLPLLLSSSVFFLKSFIGICLFFLHVVAFTTSIACFFLPSNLDSQVILTHVFSPFNEFWLMLGHLTLTGAMVRNDHWPAVWWQMCNLIWISSMSQFEKKKKLHVTVWRKKMKFELRPDLWVMIFVSDNIEEKRKATKDWQEIQDCRIEEMLAADRWHNLDQHHPFDLSNDSKEGICEGGCFCIFLAGPHCAKTAHARQFETHSAEPQMSHLKPC